MGRVRDCLELGRKFLWANEPLAMIYFVTKRCNAKCAHCFYWENLNQPRANELTLEEIDRIAGRLGRLAYLRLSGGEPFLREDLYDLVKIFVSRCRPFYVGIPTNGLCTDRIAEFADGAGQLKSLIEIGISIDGLGEQHDRIRGTRNAFARAVETFRRLARIRERTPNLRLGIITTAIKSNQSTLLELFEFLKDLGPDGISCNIVRDDTRVSDEKDLDWRTCHRFNTLCDAYNRQQATHTRDLFSRMRHHKTIRAHEIRRRVVEHNRYQIPCLAGRKIVVMYAEGEIHPCETLNVEMGNVRDWDYSIRNLLRSREAREIQSRIIRQRCFCTHECFISASVTFSMKQLARIAARATASR